MSEATTYQQGGDAQAIQRITNDYYGSYRNMFEVHGGDVPGNKMMTSAPSLIVREYGSIKRPARVSWSEKSLPAGEEQSILFREIGELQGCV